MTVPMFASEVHWSSIEEHSFTFRQKLYCIFTMDIFSCS